MKMPTKDLHGRVQGTDGQARQGRAKHSGGARRLIEPFLARQMLTCLLSSGRLRKTRF